MSLHWILEGTENNFLKGIIDRFQIPIDKDFNSRQSKLFVYKMILNGDIYKYLTPWWQEFEDQKYIQLLKRAPSVMYGLPKIIVDQTTSMLFGPQHFPAIRCEDEKSEAFFQLLCRKHQLKYLMLSSSRIGSLGSVCIIIKIVNGEFCFEAIETFNLNPIFSSTDPTELKNLLEIKKTHGEVLISMGYEIAEENLKKQFYLIREWNENEEIYYQPVLIEGISKISDIPKRVDKKRSTHHGFGFVPAVWIKNTPEYFEVDGQCTFGAIISMSFELDYQLSQLGRALRYNSDPLMVIKDPDNVLEKGRFAKSGGKALSLGEGGEAYLLEMSNQSTKAVIDYVKCIRDYALEVARGNRSNPDKLSVLQSGKALQMLNGPLISFVDELKICYVENGLLKVLSKIAKIVSSGKYYLNYEDYGIGDLEKTLNTMTPEYPDWYPPTPQDDLQEAQTLQSLIGSNVVSIKTAMQSVANKFNIVDVNEELTESLKYVKKQTVINNIPDNHTIISEKND